MSKKKKMQDLDNKIEIQKEDLVTFDAWFHLKVKEGSLKEYQRFEIETFILKNNKIKDREHPNVYNRLLKLY